jgi:Manganese-stabilising protein / photosystem II polypeptide
VLPPQRARWCVSCCSIDLTLPLPAAQAPASAISFDELQGLTYLQVKGSGIANTCPVIDGGSSNLKDIKPGNYKIQKLCLEPTSFTVKEESQFKGGDSDFVPTKLMTRLTYTLDEVGYLQMTFQHVEITMQAGQGGLFKDVIGTHGPQCDCCTCRSAAASRLTAAATSTLSRRTASTTLPSPCRCTR